MGPQKITYSMAMELYLAIEQCKELRDLDVNIAVSLAKLRGELRTHVLAVEAMHKDLFNTFANELGIISTPEAKSKFEEASKNLYNSEIEVFKLFSIEKKALPKGMPLQFYLAFSNYINE
jgi:hypothetical protein